MEGKTSLKIFEGIEDQFFAVYGNSNVSLLEEWIKFDNTSRLVNISNITGLATRDELSCRSIVGATYVIYYSNFGSSIDPQPYLQAIQ